MTNPNSKSSYINFGINHFENNEDYFNILNSNQNSSLNPHSGIGNSQNNESNKNSKKSGSKSNHIQDGVEVQINQNNEENRIPGLILNQNDVENQISGSILINSNPNSSGNNSSHRNSISNGSNIQNHGLGNFQAKYQSAFLILVRYCYLFFRRRQIAHQPYEVIFSKFLLFGFKLVLHFYFDFTLYNIENEGEDNRRARLRAFVFDLLLRFLKLKSISGNLILKRPFGTDVKRENYVTMSNFIESTEIAIFDYTQRLMNRDNRINANRKNLSQANTRKPTSKIIVDGYKNQHSLETNFLKRKRTLENKFSEFCNIFNLQGVLNVSQNHRSNLKNDFFTFRNNNLPDENENLKPYNHHGDPRIRKAEARNTTVNNFDVYIQTDHENESYETNTMPNLIDNPEQRIHVLAFLGILADLQNNTFRNTIQTTKEVNPNREFFDAFSINFFNDRDKLTLCDALLQPTFFEYFQTPTFDNIQRNQNGTYNTRGRARRPGDLPDGPGLGGLGGPPGGNPGGPGPGGLGGPPEQNVNQNQNSGNSRGNGRGSGRGSERRDESRGSHNSNTNRLNNERKTFIQQNPNSNKIRKKTKSEQKKKDESEPTHTEEKEEEGNKAFYDYLNGTSKYNKYLAKKINNSSNEGENKSIIHKNMVKNKKEYYATKHNEYKVDLKKSEQNTENGDNKNKNISVVKNLYNENIKPNKNKKEEKSGKPPIPKTTTIKSHNSKSEERIKKQLEENNKIKEEKKQNNLNINEKIDEKEHKLNSKNYEFKSEDGSIYSNSKHKSKHSITESKQIKLDRQDRIKRTNITNLEKITKNDKHFKNHKKENFIKAHEAIGKKIMNDQEQNELSQKELIQLILNFNK